MASETTETLTGQNAVLAALHPDICQDADTLAATSGLTRHKVLTAMARLIGRGLADRTEVGCYLLTADGVAWRASGRQITPGPKGKNHCKYIRRQPHALHDRAWAALRMLGKASLPQLMELVADPAKPDGTGSNSVRMYLAALAKIGWLRDLPRAAGTAPTSNGYKRYALVFNPGPLAPQHRRQAREIYDPNEKKTYPLPPKEGAV